MHRSRRALALLAATLWLVALAAGPVVGRLAVAARRRTAVPRTDRRPGRLRLRRGPDADHRAPGRGDHRRHRGPDQGRGRRLHPGARPRRHHDRRGRDPRRRADGRVGRRAGRRQRRPGHPVRPRHEPRSTARSSSTPAPASRVSQPDLQGIYDSDMLPLLQGGDLDSAVLVALAQVVSGTFEEPEAGHRRHDRRRRPDRRSRSPRSTAPSTTTPASSARRRSSTAEATIDAIETRTGAEVVVYTQDSGDVPDDRGDRGQGPRADRPMGHRAGRLQRRHGDLLRHGPEPRARPGPAVRRPRVRGRLPVERRAPGDLRERHAPAPPRGRLRRRPRGGARRRSMPRRRPSTPRRSRPRARSTPSVGLVGAPIVFLGLSGWAFFNWRRFGKDPVYLDDPSVLMPAPPPDLTAASGAMIMDGGTSRRALTTAMLDLASRGLLAFREDPGGLLSSKKVGIDMSPDPGDAVVEAQRARNSRRPIGPAEETALMALRGLAVGEDGDVHHARGPAQVRLRGRRLRQGARGARRQPRLVRREAEQGRQALDRPRRPGHRRRRHRARSPGSTSRSPA